MVCVPTGKPAQFWDLYRHSNGLTMFTQDLKIFTDQVSTALCSDCIQEKLFLDDSFHVLLTP